MKGQAQLPFVLCYDGQIDDANGEFVCGFKWDSFKEFNDNPKYKETARFFIKACNSHYTLLELAERALAYMTVEHDDFKAQVFIEDLSNAIEKAKGEA